MSKNVDYNYVKREIEKCKNDPIYFIETYGVIKPSKKPFKLFDFQKNYIKQVLNNKFVIVNKPRQCGISSVSGAICLWYAVFNPDKEIVIVSINDKEAMYFLSERVRYIYDYAPKWLVGKLTKSTEHIIKFDNGSWIEALATTKRALRGRTPSLAIIDEVAFNQYATEMMTAAMPSLIHGEHLVLISTPNGTQGIGSYFYNMWTKAEAGESDFTPVSIDWWEVPMYNDKAPNYVDWHENAWAMQQYKNANSEVEFRQEILKEWILKGETVLPQQVLDKLTDIYPIRMDFLKEIDVTPEDVYNFSEIGYEENFEYIKGFWVWEEPKLNNHYVVGVDISTGRANDYSTIEVINLNTMEQVAEYRGKIPVIIFDKIVNKIIRYYNNAFVGIEVNSDESIVSNLEKNGYENLYYRRKKKQRIAGWHTNPKTRGQLVAFLQDFLINDLIKINSKRLTNELKTFVWLNGKAQADKQTNDDLVFAFMIALAIIEEAVTSQGLDFSNTGLKGKKKQESNEKNFMPIMISETTMNNKDNHNLGMKNEVINTNLKDNFEKTLKNKNNYLINENENEVSIEDIERDIVFNINKEELSFL